MVDAVIFPVPAGVTPVSHTCGDCGGRLTMPWRQELGDMAIVCVEDEAHATYQAKDYNTRRLARADGTKAEVNILTQRETTELAPITDEPTALAAVTKANALGLFPSKDSTPQQLELLAHVALLYRLDPNMGEIMPYQGKPYITVAGRRRLDAAAGNNVSIRFRPLTKEERDDFVAMGALNPKDVAGFCVGHNPKTNVTVEGFGRVLNTEGMGRDGKLNDHLPVAVRRIEMMHKRSERRMREMMFGPTPVPEGLRADVGVLQEGDEANVVETTGHVVEDASASSPLPDLGNCPEHDIPWKVEERWNRISGSHPIDGGGWCQFGQQYGALLKGAWEQRMGGYVKTDVDTWLKANFNGKTWSKMGADEMLQAVTKLTTLPDAPLAATDGPAAAELSELPDDEDTPLETADNDRERITQYQVDRMLELCGTDIPLADLMQEVYAQCGTEFLGEIKPDQYQGLLDWVNERLDQRVARH
jgi:hypothetical protein